MVRMKHWGNGVQPKHFVKPCLLLLLQERPDYGYDLVARLRPLGVEDDSAAIYRMLRTLEAEGQVTSRWKEPVAGPARRMYEITTIGSSRLEDWAVALDESRQVLQGFLERYGRNRRDAGRPPGRSPTAVARRMAR
jgi:DNA-binding PadR family transcriptional regulator